MTRPTATTLSILSMLLGALMLFAAGCTRAPYPPVIPAGPESTKTGYSVTYRINGRTDQGEVEAAGGQPTEGNVTFRPAPVVKASAEDDEHAAHAEHK